ncbi:DUF2569 family protein [Paraburkholderia sp. GAS199]|uniref:DUF2569 family protein n=1 Tax=Paraburkholderia sp. GAS199 TaxID=3035126 RepID=UPI003D2423A4
MTHATQLESPPIRGSLRLALFALAAWAAITALTLRDPVKLMIEWELLAVFLRPETHGWFRVVLLLTAIDVMTGVFIVGGAGWLLLLMWRRSARFPRQVQVWLLAIVVMRTMAWLLGDFMAHAIGIEIAIPFDGFLQALAAAVIGIPYFRCARRVRDTFLTR